jgi:hypothetical protein
MGCLGDRRSRHAAVPARLTRGTGVPAAGYVEAGCGLGRGRLRTSGLSVVGSGEHR